MGMRLIADRSPTCCGAIGADSAPFRGRIHDSQTFPFVLSAGDGDRDRMGKPGPVPAGPAVTTTRTSGMSLTARATGVFA